MESQVEPLNGKNLHRAVTMNNENELARTLHMNLMLACFCGHLDVVRYLRKSGAVWTSQDNAGCTALHWAVDGSHLPVIQHTIHDDCQVDIKDSVSGWTPLMVSAVTGNTEVASVLWAGADVNTRDRDGKRPLMIS
ncbi:LOW QUALITY PROTEIN: ankyrin repeat domain-containing protein 33B [Diretmus argenteus]